MADTKRLQLIIDAENKTQQAMNGVSKDLSTISDKIEKMQPTFQKMALAGGAAFTAISVFATKSIKDFSEAEAAQKQLEHAVIDVTHATKEQLKATSDLADELERKGVLDGDNIKTGLAQLSTFGLSNDAVRALGGSLSDLAVNQFGVSASGEQLTQTANMIAKALNGQFGILEKSGIRFTEAQKATIEFGTEMEKVAAINEGFNQNLKYTNEVALATTEGQMAKAAVAAGNLSESIGQTLQPLIMKLTEVLVPLIEKVTAWVNENPKLATTIIAVAAGLSALVTVIGLLGIALPAIIAGFTILAGPMGIIIGVIALLVAAGVALYQNWDFIKNSAFEIWTNIANFFSEIWQNIKTVFETYVALIVGLVVLGFEAMGINIFEVFNRVSEFFSKFWSGLKALTSSSLNWLTNTFKTLTAPMAEAWGLLWSAMGEKVNSIWESVKNVIKSSINWIIDKINTVINAMNSVIAKGAGIVGVSAAQVPTIPMLAQGGIVTKPTLAMIGENGPEAVIPLRAGARAGAGALVINFYGDFYGEEGIVDRIGRDLLNAIKANVRLS